MVTSRFRKQTIFSKMMWNGCVCFLLPPLRMISTPRFLWSSDLFMSGLDDLLLPEEFDGVNGSSQFFVVTYYLRKCGTLSKLRVKLFLGKVLTKIIHHKVATSQLQYLFDFKAIRTVVLRIHCKIHIRIVFYYVLYHNLFSVNIPTSRYVFCFCFTCDSMVHMGKKCRPYYHSTSSWFYI